MPDTAVVGRLTGRRAVRSGLLWGVLLGLLVLDEAARWHSTFPTVASRQAFARTLGANAGMSAVIGPARRVDTVGGFVAWRLYGLVVIVGAIWAMLLAVRLVRREEDAGRWELLLSGRTARRGATAQALAGLAAGWLALWAVVTGFTVAVGARADVGFPVTASVFFATAATSSAALFLAVGLLAGQLAGSGRQAVGLATAAFAGCYLIRLIADAGLGLAWLRWASPLGWVENARPLTGSQPLALVPVALLTAAVAVTAVVLAGRRDLGTGLLARGRPPRQSLRLLGGATALTLRLERWVALSWGIALALLALLFAVVARTAAEGNLAVAAIREQLRRLGADPDNATAGWLGYELLFIAGLVALAAAGQISALRAEEAGGHLDTLLARPLSRRRWLSGRLAVAAGFVVVAGGCVAAGGWLGVASGSSGVGAADMVRAGLNTVPPALLVLGVGTLVFGLAPRLAGPAVYALVLWSFVVQVIGASITANHWLLDTALLSHVAPVPAADPNWAAVGWLTGLGVITALTGIAAFDRRDLAAA